MDYKLTKKDGVVTLEPSFEFICSTLRNGTYSRLLDMMAMGNPFRSCKQWTTY